MRFEWRAPKPDEPPLGAIFAAVLALAAGLAAAWLRLGLPLPVCRFREWTGYPCPTCGSTRMADALIRGNVLEALGWNPLVFVALASIAAWGASSIALRLSRAEIPHPILHDRERMALRVAIVAAFFAGWGYLVWRGV